MPHLKNKSRLTKAMFLVTTGIVISGCNTTSKSDQAANSSPAPITAEASNDTNEKGLSQDKLMSIAERAWERRNAATALRLYSMAAQKNPDDVTPYLAMAKILRKTKRADAAIEIYNSILEHRPSVVEAHSGIGYSLLTLNKPYLAAQSFEASILLEPKNARSLGGMAVALDTAGEHEKAQDYYRLAIKADTNNLIYQNNLALSLALVGRLEQAIAMFEIITSHPNASAKHRQNLALVYGMAGKSADAMRYSRMDLNESDARNNALYFQALNATPEVAEQEKQAMVMTNKKLTKKRTSDTSRQPYEILVARSNFTTLNTVAEPDVDDRKPPIMLQQTTQVLQARIPLSATEIMARSEVPAASSKYNVAAVPVVPIEKSPLKSPAAAVKSEPQPPKTKILADRRDLNHTQATGEPKLEATFQKAEKVAHLGKIQDNSSRSYFAQLGSFKSEERAQNSWTQLLKKHPDLLDDFQPLFTKVDLGPEKGTFYRVRVGSFNNKNIPLVLCQELRDRSQDCYMPVAVSTTPRLNTENKLREAVLESEAPIGTPFLISFTTSQPIKHSRQNSIIASR